MRSQRYSVIGGGSLRDLEEKVSIALDEGWSLAGDLVVGPGPHYLQPMIFHLPVSLLQEAAADPQEGRS